jgi:N-methylhydantoinase A/oxoprolinase/acetone carboxylase beta subunit
MIGAFAQAVAAEIREVLRTRSWSPQETTLIVYGGSGPLLACMVAEQVGVRTLLIPPASASFSALGVGFVELAHEYRTLLRGEVDGERWQQATEALKARGARDMFGEGISGTAYLSSLQLRNEKDGSVVKVEGSLKIPETVKNGCDGLVLDYRCTATSEKEEQFPTPERSRDKGTELAAREMLLNKARMRIPVVAAESFSVEQSGSGPCLIESSYWSAVVLPGWQWEETGRGVRIRLESL